MANREEVLNVVRQALVGQIDTWLDEDDPEEGYEGTFAAMTNLSEMAEFCQNASWDIAQFVGAVLTALGFEEQDLSYKWLNEHCYGWST